MQIVRCTRKSSLMIFKFLISVTIMKKETFFPLAGASRRSTGRQPVERGALECAPWSSPAGPCWRRRRCHRQPKDRGPKPQGQEL